MGRGRSRAERQGADGRTPYARLRLFYGIIKHLAGHYHYLTAGNQDIYEYDDQASSPAWTSVNSRVPGTAYDTDLFGARAKQWIMDHQAKASSQPFFLYLAFPAPHGCLSAPACAYPAGLGKPAACNGRKKTDMKLPIRLRPAGRA